MKKLLKTEQNYPVLSGLFSFIIVLYLILLVLRADVAGQDSLVWLDILFTQNPFFASSQFILSMLAVYILLLVWDIKRFMHTRKLVKRNSAKLRKEIEDVWESKKHLQNKAHTYSGHADKLKLFISDKLLEYIEYDEKFLHFKSIASEVRHNGVISYDIVTSLLADLQKQEESQQSGEAKNALEAMRYLWDLLDLSTADNIALHIANLLINAEEQYYQMMLERENGEFSPVIIKADFSSLESITSTLVHLVHEPDTINMGQGAVDSQLPWSYLDDQFKIEVASNQALLGNSNHVRLMLENLLKNAQHFSRKVAFKQKSDRILLSVIEGPAQKQYDSKASYIEFQVYNRGPQVLDEHKSKLFQLGYSTRRSREHHGKGLGLFFVNEIVKGYEGQLILDNIHNQGDSYSIRISLKNGDIDTQIVNVIVKESRPCIESEGLAKENSQRWQYSSAIEAIEISSKKMHETVRFNSEDGSFKKSEHFVQSSRLGSALLPPCWSLDVQPKRGGNKTHNLIFNLLDISGVRFSIKLPTAQSRLDGIEPDYADSQQFGADSGRHASSKGFISDSDELAQLQQSFKAPE